MSSMQVSSGRPHMPTSYQRGRGKDPVVVLGSSKSAVAVNMYSSNGIVLPRRIQRCLTGRSRARSPAFSALVASSRRFRLLDQRFLADDDNNSGIRHMEAAFVGIQVVPDL